MFCNLLVGIDGSAGATQALAQAIEIAQASGGRLGLLGVASKPNIWISLSPFALPVSRAQLAAELDADAQRDVDQAEKRSPPMCQSPSYWPAAACPAHGLSRRSTDRGT